MVICKSKVGVEQFRVRLMGLVLIEDKMNRRIGKWE